MIVFPTPVSYTHLVIDEIKEALEDLHIHYDIMGRSKHFYSIYKLSLIHILEPVRMGREASKRSKSTADL